MTEAIRHRGPDDVGHELLTFGDSGHSVGMGLRRLSIIDQAGGHQPMWSADRRCAIVFNGEIYNYRELRDELVSKDARFLNHSDTEVILQGWQAWGEGVVEHLEGMFAFALWDHSQRVWFLARDRFGIKPIYLCQPDPDTLAFASEIRPLLPFLTRRAVDRGALYQYLLRGWIGAEQTILEGIRQLPPAHCLLWDPRREMATPRRYWQLEREEGNHAPCEWAEKLKRRFDEAVRSHLVADVPVGITLSGGLDSSTVLASMVRNQSAASTQAFTVGYGLEDDELPYARIAARHLGVVPKEKTLSPEVLAQGFVRTVWSLEEPIAHPMLQTTIELAAFASERVKVTLIGEGSDELFAGYPHYRLFRPPFHLLPRARLRDLFLAVAYVLPSARTLRGLLTPPMLDDGLLQHEAHRFDPFFEHRPMADGALRFELESQLVGNQLLRIDKLTMAHSLEARVPFLDRRLAELAFTIPFDLKVRFGIHKQILRTAMRDRLPQEIVDRPKSGRGGTQALLPTMNKLLFGGQLSHLISKETLVARGWLDPDRLLSYLSERHRFRVRTHPIESRRRIKLALALAVLEQWARLYLDGRDPGDVNS